MARGGGGRGRKVTINSGKWQTVAKSSNTNDNSDSDDEVIAKKMSNEDWQLYLEWMADVQLICVKRGEPFLFFVLTFVLFNHTSHFSFSTIFMLAINISYSVHNCILEEIMSTYCPETSDSYERILAETKEWIQNHR